LKTAIPYFKPGYEKSRAMSWRIAGLADAMPSSDRIRCGSGILNLFLARRSSTKKALELDGLDR